MKLFTISAVGFFFAVLFGLVLSAQTPAQTPAASSDVAQLEALARKIDAQNAKIDTLSQQILKLEQQIAHIRPGVMIGEGAPSPATGTTSTEPPRPANGNTHTVTRRDAHFHRQDVQSWRGRTAKVQSNRGRPQIAGRTDDYDSAFSGTHPLRAVINESLMETASSQS